MYLGSSACSSGLRALDWLGLPHALGGGSPRAGAANAKAMSMRPMRGLSAIGEDDFEDDEEEFDDEAYEE